ncbi:hypothetical protein [Haliangium sp.]|uniref:hypothetical protein n=1 Tax=Haliangium sp. TaxID=2663208 RepID=UPI003D14E718
MKHRHLITAVLSAGLLCPAATGFAQEADEEAAGAGADDAASAGADAGGADDADDAERRDYGERRQGGERDLQYRWKTAGRHYVVPLAFFSIHGYLEGVFGGSSPDWTAADQTQLGAPGQLLVPNTNLNAFQYDAAIFISTDTSAHTRSLIELHLVSDPGGQGAAGPGGLTFAITEASVSWDLYKSYVTLGGGIFWAPFGIVNIDWLGGQSLFKLVPRASAAFPAHFNERGVRINGAKELANGFGLNYVVSLGNGLSSFDIAGQASYDLDDNKTLISRVGVYPGLGPDLELGASFAAGDLRDGGNMDLDPSDPRRYPGAFRAFGGDLTWILDDFKLRSYYINSTEDLGTTAGVNAPAINRQGFMAEASYHFWVNLPVGNIRTVVPKARLDWISVDALTADGSGANNMQTAVYSFGAEVRSAGTVGAVLSLEYHIQDEIKGFANTLDNNRFVASLLAKF